MTTSNSPDAVIDPLNAVRRAAPPKRTDPVAVVVRYALIIGFVAMFVFFALRTPLFLTAGNLTNIALASAVLLVVTVPTAVLTIMGYVDLSVGSTLGLTGVATGMLINSGVSWPLACALGVLLGAVVGLINGLLISALGLSPIIVTLGMLQLVRGAAEQLATNPPFGFGDGMGLLGRGIWLGLPLPVWISVVVFIIGAAFLYLTASGRHIYAIGVNKEASYLSGIRTTRVPLLAYVVTGVAAGVGGVLSAARLDAAPPTTLGSGFELTVLTAVLLGGIAFAGGRGSMGGALLGVAFLGVLQNGLVLLNATESGQLLATGFVLVVAAALDEFGVRRGTVRNLLRVGRQMPQGAGEPKSKQEER